MACVVIHLVIALSFGSPMWVGFSNNNAKTEPRNADAFEILESVTLDISYLAYFGYLDRKNEYFHVCQMNQNLI